jgi:hypothetical protein
VSVRAIKIPFRPATAVGLLSAAAIVAFALPASAATPFVSLIGNGGTEEFTCLVTAHGINVAPLRSADNGCANRVWLHKNLNGSGWGYCISGHTNPSIPTKYEAAQQAQVVSNKARC